MLRTHVNCAQPTCTFVHIESMSRRSESERGEFLSTHTQLTLSLMLEDITNLSLGGYIEGYNCSTSINNVTSFVTVPTALASRPRAEEPFFSAQMGGRRRQAWSICTHTQNW